MGPFSEEDGLGLALGLCENDLGILLELKATIMGKVTRIRDDEKD